MIADALERIAGIRSKTLEDNIISWPESGGEEMNTMERIDKRKQREQSPDGVEEEGQVKGQEEENAMEGVEERSGGLSPVAYFVRTGTRLIDFFEIFCNFLNKICVRHKDLYFWRSGLISIPPLRLGIPLPSNKSNKLIVESWF